MQAYIANKIISLGAVLGCIALSYMLFDSGSAGWQAILILIIIAGYGHFLLGFYYQIKSFFRTQHVWKKLCTFSILIIGSIALVQILITSIGFVGALFIGFVYFLLHGLFNEQTLLERQSGIRIPLLHLSGLAVFVMALLTYSIPDPTFYFDQKLQFVDITVAQVYFMFDIYYLSFSEIESLFWAGVATAVLLLVVAWYRFGLPFLTFGLLSVIGITTWLVYIYGAPLYIHMYFLVVGYHFMTWLLFYLSEMRRRGRKQFQTFVVQNALIIIPFIYAGYLFFQNDTPQWVYTVFNYELFVLVTYIHITTSFMNDEWFKKIEKRIY